MPYNSEQQPNNPYDAYDETYRSYTEPSFPDDSAQIFVGNCMIVSTGTYDQQYARPWVARYNHENANDLHDIVAAAYRDHMQAKRDNRIQAESPYMVDPMALAGVSSSFIQPSATVETEVYNRTLGGWGSQTGRFMMEIEVRRAQASSSQFYILVGYTNYDGFTTQQNVDPQMELTINTIFEVREGITDVGYGQQRTRQLFSVNQVLLDANFTSPDRANIIRLRPYEVATSLARQNDPTLNEGTVNSIDTRYIQNSTPQFSNQHHTNPNDYMANVLSGLVNGRDLARQTNSKSKLQPYHNAARALRDSIASRDPFIQAITRQGDGTVTATFKWRDLLRIDPTAEDRTTVNVRRAADYVGSVDMTRENFSQVGGEQRSWTDRTHEAQTAAMINNILPSLMTDLAFRKVEIFASNISGHHPICVAPIGDGIMGGVDMRPQLEALANLFYVQVVQPATFNGQIAYQFDVYADLYGEIYIKLQLDGGYEQHFVRPQFCSASDSPILTSRADNLDNLSRAFGDLQQSVLPAELHKPLIIDQGSIRSSATGTRY